MSSSRTRLGSYFLEKTGFVKTREDPLFKARYARAREVLRSSREALVSLKAWSSASSEAAKQSALAFEAISELFPPHDDRHHGPCESGRIRTGSNGNSTRARSSSGVGSRVVQLDVVHEASASDGSGRSFGTDDCECAMDVEEKGSTPVTLSPHADDRIARIVKRVLRAQDEIEGVLVPVFREHVISVLEDEVETNAKAVAAARSEEKASRRCFERKWVHLRKVGEKSCKPERLDRNAEKLRSSRERYSRALKDATIAVERAADLDPARLSKLVLRMLQFDIEVSRTRMEIVGPALSNSKKLVRESS